MLSFNFKNSGFKSDRLAVPAHQLAQRINDLRRVAKSRELDLPDGFVNLAGDKAGIKAVKEMAARKVSKKLGAVAVVGIGGSSLGAEAVVGALGTSRPIIFFDNVDPDSVTDKINALERVYAEGNYVLIVPVSKSGTTMETSANFEVVLGWLKKNDKDWRKRIVAVTDSGSPLHKRCIAEKFDVLFSHPQISGRFSFLSAVGLFPLAVSGVDIDAFLRGAASMGVKCLSGSVSSNPALRGAASLWLNMKAGRNICNNFIFSDKLFKLGIFARNLMAESLGKDGRGITPIVSVGSTDLHSMGQLYFGGPKDKFTVFMGSSFATRGGAGKGLSRTFKAIYSAVLESYNHSRLPYYSVDFGRVSPESVGEFMAMKMFETVYLAHLMDVNVFGQPAVELYKKTARRILAD